MTCRPRWKAMVLAALTPALTAGCASLSVSAAGSTAARATASSSATKTMVACIDVSRSVPANIIPQSVKLLAREFKNQPHAGSGRFIGYVRTISTNSVNPSNNLMLVDIPAVHRARHKSSSTLDPNPIQTAVARSNLKEKQRQQKDLAHARAVAATYANRVAHLRVPRDARVGTDLFACPAVAARLMSPTGPNYLLVISDLLPYGRQHSDFTSFALPKTHVDIVQYCATDLRVCDRAKTRFESVLKKGGVAHVAFHDSVQLPVLDDIFNP